MMSSRAPGWTHIRFDYLSIKKQSKYELTSSKGDSYQIWEFLQTRINQTMSSGAPSWIHIQFHWFATKNSNRILMKITERLQNNKAWQTMHFICVSIKSLKRWVSGGCVTICIYIYMHIYIYGSVSLIHGSKKSTIPPPRVTQVDLSWVGLNFCIALCKGVGISIGVAISRSWLMAAGRTK